MYDECRKINQTFGTLVSDLRKRTEQYEAVLAEAQQEFDRVRDHDDPEIRKQASKQLSRARSALRENEERSREEMRDFHVFLSDWGNGKREDRRGWCQALHSLAVASRNDKATGAIVFHAFPQEALDKLLEETGGQPIQLHLPEMPDGEIVFDDAGNVYRVERIPLEGGQIQERRIFLFRVTERGNIILDGVRVDSVQPFAIQEGSGEIRNGMVTFSNLRQRPTVRNGKPPALRTREDRARFIAACEERFGSSFSVFVDGDPASIRQLDTETGKQSFLEYAPVRPWEGRPFQRAQTIQ
jgi:hypothetical protein